MHFVEPQVFIVGRSQVDREGMNAYLEAIGAEGWETDAPSGVEEIIEVNSRGCYMSFGTDLNPNITQTRDGNEAHLANILSSGHGSVLEHSYVTFQFVNVSRVFTHELVRHRAGVAISQESLRFVRLDDIPIWIPDAFRGDDLYSSAMVSNLRIAAQASERAYRNILMHAATKEGYDSFDEMPFNLKKKYTSAARRVAPIGTATKIGWTVNMRALRHVIEMRTSEGAEEEIQLVFNQVAQLAKDNWPNLFKDLELFGGKVVSSRYRKV